MEALASVQFRSQNRDLGMVVREVDENLAIYLAMRHNEKSGNDNPFLLESDEFDCSSGTMPDSDCLSAEKMNSTANDNLVRLGMDKGDYDWLIVQNDHELHSLVEESIQDSAVTLTPSLNNESVHLKNEPAPSLEEPASQNKSSISAVSSNVNSSAIANRKPSPSCYREATPRSATPTGRPTMPTKPNFSRPTTPTLKAKLVSAKPSPVQARSITPTRLTAHSSTPVDKASKQITAKASTRSATPPVSKSSTSSMTSSIFSSNKSSSGGKKVPTMLKNPVLSRGTSSLPKALPSKSSHILNSSMDAQNLKTTAPARSASASRGRPSVPTTPLCNAKLRQKSCSPSRVRATQNGTAHKSGSIALTRSRGHCNGGDEVNPVLMGTKMVERVVNMRKLAPPKQTEYSSHDCSRKTSQENLGFGRSLSKKSLDMAIRHMDIRRSISDNI